MSRSKKLEVLNVSAFAKLMGVSGTTVTKWLDTGKISEKSIEYSGSGKPQIIVEYAVPELEKNQTPGAVRKTRTGLNIGGNTKPNQKIKSDIKKEEVEKLISTAKVSPEGKIEVKGIDTSQDPVDFYDAKLREQIAKTLKVELEVAEKRKQLVDKHEQDMQLRDLGIMLKTEFSTVPDRVAANCFAAESMHDVRNILHFAIEQVFLKFSGKVW